MLTFDATEQINEVSRTTTTQVITRYFGRWPQTTIQNVSNGKSSANIFVYSILYFAANLVLLFYH